MRRGKELASLLLGTIERTTEKRRLKIRSDSSRDCLADLKLSRRARRDQNKLLKSLKLFSRASVQSSSRLIPSSVRVRMVYAFKLSTGTKRRLHTKPFTKLLCRFHDANLELIHELPSTCPLSSTSLVNPSFTRHGLLAELRDEFIVNSPSKNTTRVPGMSSLANSPSQSTTRLCLGPSLARLTGRVTTSRDDFIVNSLSKSTTRVLGMSSLANSSSQSTTRLFLGTSLVSLPFSGHKFTLNSPNKSTSTLPRSGTSYWPSHYF
ncbi:hypothetical protein F2Q69_00012343 [Brassica cretica]|uniref:Uncharacterized protein n=1 Tax=Brassica cretica TaxID=69181 RepID=A0A8S9R8A0_BRACR|nr:hypothetical protein F2Q69_00012343 [Brassica cretica]